MNAPAPAVAALPAQVLRTYKRLVQYLHEEDVRVGDRLPPQADLRRLLGKNNYTLGAAMQALVNQGVLARKTGAGTVVTDLAAIGKVPWSVGVATIEAPVDGELSVFANLTLRVQTRLNRLGCRCVCYSHPVSTAQDRLRMFGLLERDLEDELLDGLVMLTILDPNEWAGLRARRIPVVHLPFWEKAPCGVIIDRRELTRQASQRFTRMGCRRLGIVSVDSGVVGTGSRDAGPNGHCPEFLDGRFGIAGGERVGNELLARPAAKRPDALIVLDDYIALGLTNVLARDNAYRPQIAVQVHRQLPLRYALPVHAYAIDLERLVDQAIDLLRNRLLRPTAPDTLEMAKAQLLTDDFAFASTVTVQ